MTRLLLEKDGIFSSDIKFTDKNDSLTNLNFSLHSHLLVR